MSDGGLEQKLRKVVVVRNTSPDILQKISEGKKFIIVDDSFNDSDVPNGYSLIDMKYKGESFRTLVPQNLLFYMTNPGEDNIDDALDNIADFYGEAEQYEDDLIAETKTSVHETNWATTARSTYQTYLINKLVAKNSNSSEFNPETIKALDLDDGFVKQRLKAIAAIVLGKKSKDLKEYGIDDVLEYHGIQLNRKEKIEKSEFNDITEHKLSIAQNIKAQHMVCTAASHYELKDKYKNDSEWEYDLRNRVKTSKFPEEVNLKIEDLEKEINDYRLNKHGEIGRHDTALLKTYANLSFIAKEKPELQLDVSPRENEI